MSVKMRPHVYDDLYRRATRARVSVPELIRRTMARVIERDPPS